MAILAMCEGPSSSTLTRIGCLQVFAKKRFCLARVFWMPVAVGFKPRTLHTKLVQRPTFPESDHHPRRLLVTKTGFAGFAHILNDNSAGQPKRSGQDGCPYFPRQSPCGLRCNSGGLPLPLAGLGLDAVRIWGRSENAWTKTCLGQSITARRFRAASRV
jgi:hypothetical protein